MTAAADYISVRDWRRKPPLRLRLTKKLDSMGAGSNARAARTCARSRLPVRDPVGTGQAARSAAREAWKLQHPSWDGLGRRLGAECPLVRWRRCRIYKVSVSRRTGRPHASCLPRRRAIATSPPSAAIRPGNPAPAIGPGTLFTPTTPMPRRLREAMAKLVPSLRLSPLSLKTTLPAAKPAPLGVKDTTTTQVREP